VQACMMRWVLGSVPMLVDMAGFSSWHGCSWNSGPRPRCHHAVHRLRGMAAQRTCDLWFMVNWTRFRMWFSWTLPMIKDVRFRLGIGCQSGIRCLMLTHCMGKRGIVYTAVFIPLSQMFVANLLRYEHCYYFFRLLFVNYNSYKWADEWIWWWLDLAAGLDSVSMIMWLYLLWDKGEELLLPPPWQTSICRGYKSSLGWSIVIVRVYQSS
jgi:hypothetical protein